MHAERARRHLPLHSVAFDPSRARQLFHRSPSGFGGLELSTRLSEQLSDDVRVTLIDRSDTLSGHPDVRMTNQPHREFIYRSAFEMGRHIVGYEVQKVLALVESQDHVCCRYRVRAFGPALERCGGSLDVIPLRRGALSRRLQLGSLPDHVTLKLGGLKLGRAPTLLVGAAASTWVAASGASGMASALPTWSVATL